MSFPTDGVYTIRNLARGLMLDLKDNRTVEGNTIQGYENNDTTAQQWIVRNQGPPGSANKSASIQSNTAGIHGNGFFTAKQASGEPVVYTMKQCAVDLAPYDNMYTMSFTNGSDNLVLSIPAGTDPTVKLEKYIEGNSRQLWEFNKIADL